jgi:hypothetical protein
MEIVLLFDEELNKSERNKGRSKKVGRKKKLNLKGNEV